jgi:TetR/AcrR family transcriptional repressor of nem operon
MRVSRQKTAGNHGPTTVGYIIVIINVDFTCHASYKVLVHHRTWSLKMKVSRERAAANRERIVEVASKLFREKGFDGIGVADLMKGAGLTHGGFYGHFKSKDDLAAEACGRALARATDKWTALVEDSGDKSFVALVRNYLSEGRLASSGAGCVFAALGPEAARQRHPVRRAFADGLNALLGVLARTVGGRAKAEKRKRSIAAMSEMVGAMVLARSVGDLEFASEILEAAAADLTARFS